MKNKENIFVLFLVIIMIINSTFKYKVDGNKSIIELIIGVLLYSIPIIINSLTKFKLTKTIRYMYYILVFLVYYLCFFINIRKIMNYHGLICLVSGILLTFLSLIIINKFKSFKNKNYIFNVLIIFIISIILSIVIQIIISVINSYSIVQFFKSVLITITGTFISILWYLYETITNTKLFITHFIEEIRDNYE